MIRSYLGRTAPADPLDSFLTMAEVRLPWGLTAPTWFYDEHDQVVHCEVNGGMFILPIGMGVVWNDGRRWRVRDAWLSYDHHGHFAEGMHIFLEPVGEDDDTLADIVPDYFAG